MLNRTIRKHAERYEYDPAFISAVTDSFFVDDFTGGEETFKNALMLYRKLKLRFLEGQLHLRKWRTNVENLRHIFNTENQDETNLLTPSKILGVMWDETRDVLIYDFDDIISEAIQLSPTKRNILRILAMFYDPLGVTQPVIMSLKILFQDICKDKVGWDDELDDVFSRRWDGILKELTELGKVEISRRFEQVDDKDAIVTRELHGFCDANEKAYGACIFVRTLHGSGKVSVVLLTAKSRVAPIKEVTIPRLELLGNLLLSRLIVSVKEALHSVEFDREFLWTDSMISLAWVKAKEKEFKVFVENRVREIRRNTDTDDWYYVKTSDNPADILSRGGITSFIKNQGSGNLWWNGPSFLKDQSLFNTNDHIIIDNNKFNEEVKNKTTQVLTTKTDINNSLSSIIDPNKYSSYAKLIRVTAWVYRFCKNIKSKLYTKSHLTPTEINHAEESWIKINQSNHDQASKQYRQLSAQLNVYTDERGILRCRGRLQNAPLSNETKHPILISRNHVLSKLIVTDIHERYKHVPQNQTISQVRQRFWIPGLRGLVRRIIYICRKCKLHNAKSYNYPESPPLTDLRLDSSRSFANTGIDNFGPMYVQNIFENGDKQLMHKVWGTLYTCASTRAIILDLVPRMKSDALIRSFKRFISRRGCPSNMISDNGSNFVSDETQNFVSSIGVEWHLNLPLAPWHGGFFERLIRTVKELLRKQLRYTRLDYEQLLTVIFEVEMIVNNRPLTHNSSDDIELCLTPNQLLFGRNLDLQTNHKLDLSYDLINATEHNKKINNILNHFWDRWQKEYLVNLRETHRNLQKRNINSPTVRVNDTVLIEDKTPRSQWKLARVLELIKGHDEKIRGALVRTSQGTELKRPANKLYPIECVKYNQIENDMINDNNDLVNDNNDLVNDNNDMVNDNNDLVNDNKNEVDNDINNGNESKKRLKREAAVVGELKRKFLK